MEGNVPSEAELLRLEQRFVGLAAGYEQAKADAEGRVSSWKWFRSNALDLRPFYFEREGWKPATPLRHRPNRLRNTVEYGFDTRGNVVVERDYMTDAGTCYETFRLQDDPVVELARFDYHDEKKLNSVCHLMYRNDLLCWCALRGRESGWAECYFWSGGQLSGIDVAACEPPARRLEVVAQYSFFYEGGRLRAECRLARPSSQRERLIGKPQRRRRSRRLPCEPARRAARMYSAHPERFLSAATNDLD